MRRASSPFVSVARSRLVSALTVIALAVIGPFIASDVRADDIVVDLKGGASPPALWPTGIPDQGTVFWEEEGLRIKLEEGRTSLDHAGFRTRFVVSGDFEVTASCDLIDAGPNAGPFGSGARLFVKFDSPKGEMASLSRVKRKWGGDVYLAHFVWKDGAGLQVDVPAKIPAESEAGWLRIRREGDTLYFEAADDGKEYKTIQYVLVGEGDVQEIALTATTGFHKSTTEVRWKEFRVIADELGTKPTLPKKPSRFWFYVLCGVMAAVVLAVPIGIAFRRKR